MAWKEVLPTDTLVFYADILGFSRAVTDSDPAIGEKVLEAAESVLGNKQTFDNHPHIFRCGLSDSIFIAYEDLPSSVRGASSIMRQMGRKRILLRGALAEGSLILRPPIFAQESSQFRWPKEPRADRIFPGNLMGRPIVEAVRLAERLKGPRLSLSSDLALKFEALHQNIFAEVCAPTEVEDVWEILWPVEIGGDAIERGREVILWLYEAMELLATSLTYTRMGKPHFMGEDIRFRQPVQASANPHRALSTWKELITEMTDFLEYVARSTSQDARSHLREYFLLTLRAVDRTSKRDPHTWPGLLTWTPAFWEEIACLLDETPGLPREFAATVRMIQQQIHQRLAARKA
ncbi:MAG: hypothetical protein WD688_25760 [Candidatus Binatia bacterium]